MQRIEEYNQLLEDSKEVLRKDTTLWKGFLKFATQFTHYQFFDQILIYVQNPKATACATFDQWKKIGRYVRKGEHSIVLLDETGKRGKLRHIFDVTATGPDQEFEYRPKPILPEQREELARKLNAAYSRENSAYAADSARWDGDLEHTLSQIALSMTQEYYNLSPDQAAAQSESTEIPAYYIATATSAMYLLLEKYGFSQEAESLDFSCMNQLDMETFSGVGNAASAILSWTARLVRTVQREQVRERGNEHERNDNGRYSETDHISSGGRFPGSEHRTPGERRESAGVTEVRDDAEKLSEGEQPSGIRESGSEWNTVSGDGEGGRSSGSDQGTGITATAQGRGSDRGTETERSAQMGGTDGILPPSGGGNYSDGTGVQLTLSDYFEIRPTDRENVSDSDTPKAEHEEIQIEQTEQAAGETPAAFVIPESELVRILQRGSGFEGGKIRIAAFYQKESDAAKRAAFLKEEYGIGGWTFQFEEGVTGWVDWNARGLSIKKFHDEDNSVVKLSWLQVEKRIGQLIENDQYFLESEKVEVEPVAEETADEDAEINDEIELDENLDEEEMQESLIEPQSEKEPVSESDTKQNGAVEQEPILSGQNADEKPIAFSEPEKPILDSISGINFRISDEHLGEGSPKQKFRANMDAIHMLKKLETEERNATWQEQEILSKYVGWGGIPEAFDEKRAQWANEYQELKETLTEEEYIAARASTLNAHFTSPAIIRGIYAALERMGFQGGNILEPAMGVGNFFGMLPTTLLGSRLYGIELDSISGRIAQKLYPMANITVAGFETTNQRDFYDVAVGNVPFGNYKVNDRAYNRLGFSIHNYFFAKSLDQIRPGGIIAYVTSHYTMDSKNPSARRYLAQRAKLLGAIRLPDHAFRANAGAEVVADILFLQKREHIVETEDDWIYLGQTDKGYAINTYFLDHPEMILGTLEEQSTQFGKEYTVKADQNQDLSKLLLSAVTKIQGHYEPYEPTAQPEPRSVSVSYRRQQNAVLPADPSVRNFSYTLVDGEVYYRENSTMRKIDRSDAARDRTKGLLKIRDALNQVIQLQVEDATDEEIQRAQRKLGIEYNLFSKRYGLINSRQNALMMDGDSSYFLLCSLENLDKDGNLRSKADIFTKRTIRAQQEITFVETPADALAVSIGEKGHVDLPYMADLLGKGGEAEQEQITRELSGVIFRDPQEKEEQRAWKTADEYLSGNVRDKLRMAQLAAQRDVRYEENVRALQEAQPKNLTASEIDVRLGATWIDAEYIEAFMYETFHTPYYQRQRIKLTFAAVTGEWQISGKTFALENDVSVYNRYGTARMGAYAILEQTLNLRTVTVYDRVTDAEGTTRSVVNPRETMLAQQKQAAIKEAFAGWIWKDPQRRKRLEQVYNERFNNLRPAEFSGEHIRFHGMNPAIKLRTHQKNAIAHILYGGNTLLAHEVGAGKTYTMVAAAMESKRLGLCQKSLFVVPNHLTLQWANDFLKLYPAANLLVASKKDFETANRKKFCARIATGDYDAIIIGHSQFERIPVSIERQERLLQKQLDEIEDALQESMSERDQFFTIKQMEKTRKSLKSRLEKLQAQERKDDVVTFEQLGVDRLFVDEAHAYKNLFLYTKMRNVAGLSASEAQKSTDMYMKCRYMDELTGEKGIIFATGTPISNSMTEMYTMMRYLQYSALQERGLTQFDAWASTFGETVTASELAPEGTGYRQKTRFSKFFNLPELMNLFKQVADIKTKDQLNLPVPRDETKTIVAQPSELQKKMVAELSERAAAVHNGSVNSTVDNMLKITSDGRKIGLDQRLMNSLLPDDATSKVNLCVGNVIRIWEEGKENRLTQLIFCDNSVPKPNTFNIYDDVKGKLIAAGIPETKIAYIHDADTEVKKKNLFSKVNDGQVRILLGSTQKMGAGTNVQERLIAVHHLDVGWRPADMTQRNGRIIRQGNRNPVVQVYNYVTEGTFDSYLWQTLENKQKFISQIMTSKSPVRSCEDVDEQVLTYAEVKALCAGDDRIKEKMDLEVDIARLRMLKAEHQSMKYRLEDQLLKTFPEQIREKEGIIQKLDADIKTTEQYPPFAENTIFLEILGKVYTDQKEAAKAFLEAGKTCKDTRSIRIGSYRGFELEGYVNVITAEIQIAVKGKLSHPFELSDVPALNLKRLDSALNKLPERMILEKGKLEALYQQREDAQKQLNTPFPQEDELREKTKRLEELAVELDVDAGREPQENEDNEKTTMKISKPTGIRQSRFSRFRRQKDEKEEDADEDIDF